jgi:hypothetical protein
MVICLYFSLLGFWFSSTDGGFRLLVLFTLEYIFVVGRCYRRLFDLLFGLFSILKKLMLLHSNVFGICAYFSVSGMELETFTVLFFFSLACRT